MIGRLYLYPVMPGSPRYALVRSPQWTAARDVLVREQIPAFWSGLDRGWCVRHRHVADLVAVFELAGWLVTAKHGPPPDAAPRTGAR